MEISYLALLLLTLSFNKFYVEANLKIIKQDMAEDMKFMAIGITVQELEASFKHENYAFNVLFLMNFYFDENNIRNYSFIFIQMYTFKMTKF